MTGAWSLVASLTLLLILAGWVFRNGSLLAMAMPFLFFLLFPLWNARPRPDFRVKRQLEPDHLMGGQPCAVEVEIENRGEDLEEVFMTDLLPPGLRAEGNSEYHGPWPAGQVKSFSYTVRGVRGQYQFAGVSVSAGDLMDFLREDKILSSPGVLAVLPEAEKLERMKISPRRTRVFTGMIRSRESGAGVEFFGTRGYVPGDSLRHLNWKAGARWDLLITNLFEQERIADVGIILDARSIMEIQVEEESIFEHSVRAAASLAQYFLEEGNRVGLLVYGSHIEWTFPGYGKKQQARIMTALAGAELGEHAVFKEFASLPTRLFPAESQVVLISPLRGEDVIPLRYLRALGYRVLIVSPDPVSFEKRMLPQDPFRDLAESIARMEREATLAKLRRSGVQVVDWNVTEPLWLALKSAAGERRR